MRWTVGECRDDCPWRGVWCWGRKDDGWVPSQAPGEIFGGVLGLELAPLPLNSTRCHGHCKPNPRYRSMTFCFASHTCVGNRSGSTRILPLVVSAPSTSTSTRTSTITAQFSTPPLESPGPPPSGISRQITQPHTSVSQGDTTPPPPRQPKTAAIHHRRRGSLHHRLNSGPSPTV